MAVVGPDGSGKSTISEAICVELHKAGLSARHVHFYPDVPVGTSRGNEEPHNQPTRSTASSLAAVLWRFARYQKAEHRLRVHHALHRDILLQERGWRDQLVDPVRYRLSTKASPLVRFLTVLLSQPELTIVCAGDAAAMVARKPEISEQQVDNQIRAWQRLASQSRFVLTLDTTQQSVAQASRIASKAVEEVLAGNIPEAAVASPSAVGITRVVPVPNRLMMHASGSARTAIETLYQPSTLLGRLARFTAVYTMCRVATNSPEALPMVPLANMRALQAADGFALIRSQRRDRWVVAFQQDNRVSRFAKIGNEGDGALLQEAAALEAFDADSPSTFRTPSVASSTCTNGWIVVEQEAIARGPGVISDRAVLSALIELGLWQGAGLTHGDLTPWNMMLDSQSRLTIVDWEYCGPFQLGCDYATYVISSRLLHDRPAIKEAMHMLSHTSRFLQLYASGLGLDSRAVHAEVQNSVCKISQRFDEFGDVVRKRLQRKAAT